MAISTRTEGTWAASAANATSITPTIPTHQTGDMLLMRFFAKGSNGTSPATLSPSIDQSWTLFGNGYTYTNVSGNGTGSVYGGMAYKIATSSAETDPTLTYGTSTSPGVAVIDVYQKGSGETWSTPVGGYLGYTSATSISVTLGSDPGVTAGDLCVAGIGHADNDALTSPTFTQAGVTYNTVTEWPATAISTANGNDLAADGCYRIASSGTGSAAPVITGTADAAQEGIVTFARLRVSVSTSANAGVATATSAANADTAKVSASSGAGAATGAAQDADGLPAALSTATLAEATTAALDATVTADEGEVTFDADCATVTAAAVIAHMNLSASAGYARARTA